MDKALLEELYQRYGAEIFRYLYAMCPDRLLAEDIACVNAVFQTNDVIARLEEQKSGIEAEKKSGNTLALKVPVPEHGADRN